MKTYTKYLLSVASLVLLTTTVSAEIDGVELSEAEIAQQKQAVCDQTKIGFEDFKETLSKSTYSFWGWYSSKGHRSGSKKPSNFGLINEVEFVCDVITHRENQTEVTSPAWRYIERKTSEFRRDLGLYIVGDTKIAPNNTSRVPYANLSLDHIKNIKNTSGLEDVNWAYAMAIWSMESDYGGNLGNYSILDALVTLAFLDQPADGVDSSGFKSNPTARAYRKFYNKLHNVFDALWIYERLLERKPSLPADDSTLIRGSWAGAFGHTQFMPTTYRDHYDNSLGLLITWDPQEPLEGLVLTHKFFAKRNSDKNQLWGVQVTVKPGQEVGVFNKKYLQNCNSSTHNLRTWKAAGLEVIADDAKKLTDIGQSETVRACLNTPMGVKGPMFLTFPNYDIFKAYNNSHKYSLSGALLAERFEGVDRQLAWPKELRKLGKEEVKDLQRLLGQASPDGIAGTGTQTEIYKLQRACQRNSGGAHRNTSVINKFLNLCRSSRANPSLEDNGQNKDFIAEVRNGIADGYPTEAVLYALVLSEKTTAEAQELFNNRGLGHFDRIEIQEYLGFQGSDVDGLFGPTTRRIFNQELARIRIIDSSIDTDTFKDSNGNPNRAFLNYSRSN